MATGCSSGASPCGGRLTRELVARRPELARGLALICPVGAVRAREERDRPPRGHNAQFDRPEIVEALIRDWLDRVRLER